MKEPTGRENVSVNPPEWRGAAQTSRTRRNTHHSSAQLKATSAAGASDRRLAIVFNPAPEAPIAPQDVLGPRPPLSFPSPRSAGLPRPRARCSAQRSSRLLGRNLPESFGLRCPAPSPSLCVDRSFATALCRLTLTFSLPVGYFMCAPGSLFTID